VSPCLLLPSTVCPLFLSTSHCTDCWFCITVSTAVVCRLSVSTSHCTVCWFCVTMSTAAFYSLSTVCQYLTICSLSTLSQYLTLYSLLVLCHSVYCFLLQSIHCLSVPHTVQSVHSLSVPYNVLSVGSVSLCPLLPSTVCPLSVRTSHFRVCWFCVAMSTAVFYSMSTVCQYLTLYSLLVLCRYLCCCLLQSVHCLSVRHVPFADCRQTAYYPAAVTVHTALE